jgi:PST family polysaccharide transporter
MGQPSNPSQDITGSAVRGVFWVGGGQVIRQIVGILTYIVLARLLVPDDFGLMGMVMVFVGFSRIFADFGIGSAIVQSKEVNQTKLSSSFWTNLAVSVFIALILMAASPWVADFYDKPELTNLVMTLSSTLILAGMVTTPKAILYRSMNFGAAVKAEVIGSLVAAGCTVLLAYLGFGVWSLVLQPIIGNITVVVLTFIFSAWVPTLVYSWKSIEKLVGFSGNVIGSDILAYMNRNADDLIIGKFLGSNPLGQYSLAYQIMLYPLQQVASIIVKVLFPTLSKLLDDLDRFRNIYLKAIASIALITFPMMLGLLAVSEDFVIVVFGDKWLPMVPILQIFCFLGMLQSVVTPVGTIYLSTGKPRIMLYMGLVSTPMFITAFLIGVSQGATGVAVAYAIVSFIMANVTVFVAFNIIHIKYFTFYKVLFRPFMVSLLMFLTVKAVYYLMNETMDTNSFVRLVVAITAGVVSYLLYSLLLTKGQIMELISRVRSSVIKR